MCSAESSRVKGVQRPKRVMIQQNTPTNELIEVIQEISHEFTLGFPFITTCNTRVQGARFGTLLLENYHLLVAHLYAYILCCNKSNYIKRLKGGASKF